MAYDQVQMKVFPIKELKELASNMSVSKSGNREDLVMRLQKTHAPMLKMLFDKCKKEKEEKKKEAEEKKKEKKENKEKPQIIMAQGEMFSEKFITDYNLKYVKSVTDANGNVNHHYVFKNAGKTDPKTDSKTAASSTVLECGPESATLFVV